MESHLSAFARSAERAWFAMLGAFIYATIPLGTPGVDVPLAAQLALIGGCLFVVNWGWSLVVRLQKRGKPREE